MTMTPMMHFSVMGLTEASVGLLYALLEFAGKEHRSRNLPDKGTAPTHNIRIHFSQITVKPTSLHSLPHPSATCIRTTMRDIDSNSAAIVMELWDTARYEGDNFYANFGQVTLDRYVCL